MFVCIVKILQYERIDVSEGIDFNKTNKSKKCKFCYYWFFKDDGFRFQPHVCNKCHDLLTKTYGLENAAILSAKGATFRCLLWCISRNESLKKLNNSVLENKGLL